MATHAAQFAVTRADDPAPNGCLPNDCSLREAVAAAAQTPEADLILLQAGQYQVTRGTLLLGGLMEIRGPGSAQTRIVSSLGSALTEVPAFANVTLRGAVLSTAADIAVDITGSSDLLLYDVIIEATSGGAVTTANAPGADIDVQINRRPCKTHHPFAAQGIAVIC